MYTLDVTINDTVNNTDEIRLLIKEYERQQAGRINVKILDWSLAWKEFMKINIYQHGAVISEAGDTWMGSLISRNCLRPFTEAEVASFGGAEAFLGEMWQSCIDFENKNIIAIPWSVDTSLIYYRRDMLSMAKIDEDSAFSTIETFAETIEKLQLAGIEIPIALPTGGKSNSMIHQASSWVWNRGGSFISEDGKQITFTTAETLAGLKDYFDLYRFIPPAAQNLEDQAYTSACINGNAAITLQIPPLLRDLKNGAWPVESLKNIGIAVQPGVPFIGGSNLIIWNHIQPAQENPAIELIGYITSTACLKRQFEKTGLIPARLEILNEIEADPMYAPLVQSLKTGRAYKCTRFWGLVEERLLEAMESIWRRLFSDPDAKLEKTIQDALIIPEERLNLSLSQ